MTLSLCVDKTRKPEGVLQKYLSGQRRLKVSSLYFHVRSLFSGLSRLCTSINLNKPIFVTVLEEPPSLVPREHLLDVGVVRGSRLPKVTLGPLIKYSVIKDGDCRPNTSVSFLDDLSVLLVDWVRSEMRGPLSTQTLVK